MANGKSLGRDVNNHGGTKASAIEILVPVVWDRIQKDHMDEKGIAMRMLHEYDAMYEPECWYETYSDYGGDNSQPDEDVCQYSPDTEGAKDARAELQCESDANRVIKSDAPYKEKRKALAKCTDPEKFEVMRACKCGCAKLRPDYDSYEKLAREVLMKIVLSRDKVVTIGLSSIAPDVPLNERQIAKYFASWKAVERRRRQRCYLG